jgi:hypothetical protein
MQSWHTCHVQLSSLLRLATRWVRKPLHVHGMPAASVRTHLSHQPGLVGGVCLKYVMLAHPDCFREAALARQQALEQPQLAGTHKDCTVAM